MPITTDGLPAEIQARIARKFPRPVKKMHDCRHCSKRCPVEFAFCWTCAKSLPYLLFNRYHTARTRVVGLGTYPDTPQRVAEYEAIQAECLEYLKGESCQENKF